METAVAKVIFHAADVIRSAQCHVGRHANPDSAAAIAVMELSRARVLAAALEDPSGDGWIVDGALLGR